MFYFGTYFDKNYLSRGLVLYESIREHCDQFEFYVLCLDKLTLGYFQEKSASYPEIKIVSLNELEELDNELSSCKNNRSKIEYYFTLSPCLPLYILKKYGLPHICSLDADILFLDDPASLFNYLNEYSVIITPHKFSDEVRDLAEYGMYNVSFQVFKNDETGIKCLEYWRTQCIDWCGDHYDEKSDRFADQKYLDNWTELYPSKVKILMDAVSGIAPWNLNNYKITIKEDHFYSGTERMIFYHFHHFKFFNKKWAANGFDIYQVKARGIIRKLYLLYWNKLNQVNYTSTLLLNESVRNVHSANLSATLFKENCVYFKFSHKHLVAINFATFPHILKRIIIKINGSIN